VKNTKDLVLGEKIKALVYGRSGSGKTFGALTFPRPLVFDFDEGIATARNPLFVTKYGKKDILYERFGDVTTKRGVVEQPRAFDDACTFLDKMLSPEHIGTFDTIIIDSATTLTDLAMNKGVVILGSNKLSQSFNQAKLSGLLTPKMQDYQASRSLVEQFIDLVKAADKHIVLICHEYQVLNEETGVVQAITPLLTGKSREAIPLKFDEVWNLRVSGTIATRKRGLCTEDDGIRQCRSRTGIPMDTPFEWNEIQKAVEAIRVTQTQNT